MSENTLLVTGASGHLGQRVLQLLVEAGAGKIIAATRTAEKFADFQGVTARYADFNDAATLAKAFAGVDRLLLISTDAVDGTDLRLKQQTTAVKAAEEAGVKHVIYTSIIHPGPESPVKLSPDHHGTETALANTQMGYTFLRNNIYADLQVGSLARAVGMGQLFSAAGDGKAAYVTREDCAKAAAAALADDFSGRRALDITGPDALSQADLAAIASRVTGKPVTYVPIELEALIQGMVGAGLPRPLAEIYASFDTAIAQGIFAEVSDDFETLTGQKRIHVADLLAEQMAQA